MSMRVVVWVTEGTWQGCVDAAAGLAPPDADITLLHVNDGELAEAMHGVHHGLLGRRHEHEDDVERLTGAEEQRLLEAAAERLGRPSTTRTRSGEVQHVVTRECEGADLLVCARDGRHDHPGPHSLGHHTRFVVDHAPCAVLLVWPG